MYVYSGDRPESECDLPELSRQEEDTRVAQAMDVLFARPLPLWKRALDIAGAATALMLASPIMLLAAAAIKATSPGARLFTQMRDTIGGRPFKIYKFRTMCVDAEEKKADLQALDRAGRAGLQNRDTIARDAAGTIPGKTSIDELPQLFNVLLGDMSLVGPRPLPCDESDRCEPWQRHRLDVTPGLTCIWQVQGRSSVSFSEWAHGYEVHSFAFIFRGPGLAR